MHLSGADSASGRRPAPATGPADAFDALFGAHAPGVVRQAFLLTGQRVHAHRAAGHAFEAAWQCWPEVTVDPDPAGWVRAVAYEYALSPWRRLRPSHRRARPGSGDGGPGSVDPVLAALLCLPPSYRRALLLHDGVGLGLPEMAAEVEASPQAAASRVVNARAAMTDRLPGLHEEPERLTGMLAALLDDPATAAPLRIGTPRAVRDAAERRNRLRTRGILGSLAVATAATAFVAVAAPGGHAPPGEATPAATGSRRPVPPLPGDAGPDRPDRADRADGKGGKSGKGDRADGRSGAPGKGLRAAGKRQRPPQAVDGRPGNARLTPEAR